MATERFIRWFQYHALTPMLGPYGQESRPDALPFPAATQPILRDYVKLRHHLSPYLQFVARRARTEKFAVVRTLRENFPDDMAGHRIRDQFMIGPSLMVNPVPPGYTSRTVYLPAGFTWFDFWSGAAHDGGQPLHVPAPLRMIPLFVTAGAIIPYATAVPPACGDADPIELRIYPGRSAGIELYEGESATHRCPHATVSLDWNDTDRVFKIEAHNGSKRTFRVVLVRPRHGAGLAPTSAPDRTIAYTGVARTTVRLRRPSPAGGESPPRPRTAEDALAAILPAPPRFEGGQNSFRQDEQSYDSASLPFPSSAFVHEKQS